MSDTEFLTRLHIEYLECLLNDFGKENFDEHRFGKFKQPSLREKIAKRRRRTAIPAQEVRDARGAYEFTVAKYAQDFDFIYRHLEEPSRQLLIKLILYRALGYRRVMLPRNDGEFWEAFRRSQTAQGSERSHRPALSAFHAGKVRCLGAWLRY